ncbi:sodium:solute symporter family transporter [Litorimonas haliclonae]|uniref:sodium:solute symporter family transporter n=1 Tax=Litorimonas haliclonae TaxID=2081977 RepID=UPI0039EFC552
MSIRAELAHSQDELESKVIKVCLVTNNLTLLDGIILLGLISAFLGIGIFGSSKTETTEDYFLAGRKLKWHQIGFSLFATNFSASALIGITGAAYVIGIAIYNYEWVGILALAFFALVMVGVVRGSKVYTIAEYLTERFDSRVKVIYSVFIILMLVFLDMAGSLYAGGLLLNQFIPGLSTHVVIVLVMLIAGLYSVVGGMTAISRTDLYQSIILILGAFMIAYFSFSAVGGWAGFMESAPKGSLNLIRGFDDRAVPWTGLIVGVPIIGAYYWLVNQNMVQWVLSAESQTDARRGLLLAGALKTLGLFVIVLPGIAAISLIPGLTEPDRIYPAMLAELLPAGILGLVLAGFVSALLSNTDSTLHAASTLVTMDFVKRRHPEISSHHLVRIGRISTFVIIGVSAIWAPFIGNFGTLFEYVQGVLSYAVAPFVVVYLGGMFWPRATSNGAIAALTTGLVTAALIGLFGDGLGLFDIHYLHVPLPVTLVSLVTLNVVSRMSEAPDVDPRLLWSATRTLEATQINLARDRWIALGLVAITAASVIIFW